MTRAAETRPAESPLAHGTVVVVGGCGHVGLPLALASAKAGRPTVIYDIDRAKLERVQAGEMPFQDEGGEALLRELLQRGELLRFSDRPEVIAEASVVVLVVGTPVDEYFNPRVDTVFNAVEPCLTHFRPGQTLILRSTVFPGLSARLQEFLRRRETGVEVAFCPERVAQGKALREIQELPQIISAFSPRGLEAARAFFAGIAPQVIELAPLEAELAKLFTNCYRYIQFAAVNQFYMIAESHGADYARIHEAITRDYPRLAHYPGPGFAAGPCLLKDTMQLAAFYQHHFSLGLASVWVNESLPDFIVTRLRREHSLADLTVGILGMAFKGDNDDIRDSLSYKLRKLLRLEARRVICHDPFVADPSFLPLEQVLAESDVLVVGAPHSAYRGLTPPAGKAVIDVWGCLAPTC